MNDHTRTLAAGKLVCVDLGRGMLRIEIKTESQYGDRTACVIPPEILEEVRAMPAAERRQLLKWLGFEVPYSPVLFSKRLNETCRPGTHAKIAARIAAELGVSQMCVSHWRKSHSLPTEDQARRIAGLLGWDPEEALSDLRHEAAVKAAAGRKRMVAAHTKQALAVNPS